MARNAVVKPVTIIEPMLFPATVPADVVTALQGCSVALRIIMAAKVHSLNDLGGTIPDHIICPDAGLDLIANSPHASLVRYKTKEAPTSLTIAMCDTCRRWRFHAKEITTPQKGSMARPPTACKLSLRCEGQVYVAHAARIAGKDDNEDASQSSE